MDVMIGIDPHKGSHTAVVIDQDEVVIAEARVTHKIPPAKKGRRFESDTRLHRKVLWDGGLCDKTRALDQAKT